MKTPTGEPYTIQGCYGPVTRYTYPCKFELECSKYNPARTLTVTVGIKDHPETNRKIVKPNPCPILPFAKCCEALAEFGVKEAGVPQQTVGTVTATMHKLTRGMPLILQARNQSNELRIYEHACPTLTARMGTGGGNVPLVAACLTPNRLEKRQNGRRFKEPGEEMFTLTAQDIHGLYIDGNIRTLTERECERLQGFPDDWTLGVSRQQRYHTLGNAVTVPVIRYLGQLLLEAF